VNRNSYPEMMAEQEAPDLSPGYAAPIRAGTRGNPTPRAKTPLTGEQARDSAWSVMDAGLIAGFEHMPEMNLAIVA